MAGKVVFEVTRGALTGEKFTHEGKARIFVGRQEDCGIVVPESTVSRYHCVLEITPPQVKLQDFGSLNGTFLNGEKIGQRDREKSWEEARDDHHVEFLLHDGDVLGLGSKCELKLSIEAAEACALCGAALPPGCSGSDTLPEDAEPMYYNSEAERICTDCHLKLAGQLAEQRLAEMKAREEAEREKAEQARLAAEKAEQERIKAEQREKECQLQAEKMRKQQDEAHKQQEAEERKRKEAERRHFEEEKRREAEQQRIAAQKAAAERAEAERLAKELAEQLAAKPTQKKCAGCGKPFLPTAQDNNLCSACLADRAKVLDAVLRAMLGGVPAEKVAESSPVKGYQKVKLLGKGGMGEVWKVQDENTGKYYALKTMLPEVAADDHTKKLFLREAEVGKCLSHKNIVNTHQTGCANGVFYILMDLCEGGSVDGLMEKKGGRLSLTLATWITLQVLAGLQYVHNVDIKTQIQKGLFKGTADAHGVVHRDFKPGNIFLSGTSDFPVAMVADFGMAKAFDSAGLSRMTKSGTVMGTPVFMPRQQAIDFKYAKPEVDIWAAAASYYNMLTGAFAKNFRPGKNVWQIIVTEAAVPIRDRDPSIPQPLAKVIDRALVEQPAIGYSSAAAFQKDIIAALPENVKQAVKGVL